MDILEVDAHYRRKVAANARSLLFKLLPFLISILLYFSLWVPEPSKLGAVIKCLPTLSLVLFVALQSQSVGPWTHYAKRILQGLMFSVVGDACLVWPELFLPGTMAFAACHLCYISAFGLRPFRPLIFLLVAASGIAPYTFLLLPCLEGLYVWVTMAYSCIILTMSWRTLSQPGCHLSSSAGSMVFVISDLLVSLDKFCSSVPHARLLTMITYYIAQSLITISVAFQNVHWKES